MDEERLIAITSKICQLGGHLWPILYLTELNDNERNIFLQKVASSKYSNIALCYAIVGFSHDYLKSKNISILTSSTKSPEEEEREITSYLENMMLSDKEIQISGKKRK